MAPTAASAGMAQTSSRKSALAGKVRPAAQASNLCFHICGKRTSFGTAFSVPTSASCVSVSSHQNLQWCALSAAGTARSTGKRGLTDLVLPARPSCSRRPEISAVTRRSLVRVRNSKTIASLAFISHMMFFRRRRRQKKGWHGAAHLTSTSSIKGLPVYFYNTHTRLPTRPQQRAHFVPHASPARALQLLLACRARAPIAPALVVPQLVAPVQVLVTYIR